MQKPSLGWQFWSPPYTKWHGLPHWDYSPLPYSQIPPHKLQSRRPLSNPLSYWCSWYAFGTQINTEKIINTAKYIREHNLNLTHILIDDGWTKWGDWLSPNLSKFKDLKNTIYLLHKQQFKVGIWVSPFLASRESKLFRSHPDWFISYRNHPIQGLRTIPIWNHFLPHQYLLNYNLLPVQDYLQRVFDYLIQGLKIDFLKLDFLYAPYFDPHLTSATQVDSHLTNLFRYLHSRYPQVTTIACGAPFNPTAKLADIIRISKDTALPPQIPSLINRYFYRHRINLLKDSLLAASPTKLNIDPDVRCVRFDSPKTTQFWHQPFLIKGVGDDLTQLTPPQLIELKAWLSTS